MLQKERDKREAHAQGTKDLRIKYITGIYEAELAQVEDEFQVRWRPPARCFFVGSARFGRANSPPWHVALHRQNSGNTRTSCSRGSERR